jgi:hypothetical protein
MEFEVSKINDHANNWIEKKSCDKLYSEIEYLQDIDGNVVCSICKKYLGKNGEDSDENYEHVRQHHKGIVEVRNLDIYKLGSARSAPRIMLGVNSSSGRGIFFTTETVTAIFLIQ